MHMHVFGCVCVSSHCCVMNAAGSEERGLPRIALTGDLLQQQPAAHPSRTHAEHTAFFSAVAKLHTLLKPKREKWKVTVCADRIHLPNMQTRELTYPELVVYAGRVLLDEGSVVGGDVPVVAVLLQHVNFRFNLLFFILTHT